MDDTRSLDESVPGRSKLQTKPILWTKQATDETLSLDETQTMDDTRSLDESVPGRSKLQTKPIFWMKPSL
ncbi:hypothetical protein Fmac_021660 [Flemingia macrophylla]|uniref:Uncharacterized protein n=1 Tax=Flemingia macrophylla TaxID=520843 RepID=A0ABD1LY29_9FABA